MNKIDKKDAISRLIKLVVKKQDQESIINPTLVSAARRQKLARNPTLIPDIKSRWNPQSDYKLRSYLSVCVESGQVDRSIQILSSHERINVSHFNTVLKTLARAGSMNQIRRLNQMMLQRDIQPNLETYANNLLGHAKCKNKNTSLEYAKTMINEINRLGDIKKIFHSSYFNFEEQALVKALIKRVIPDFQEKFLEIPVKYKCKLMDPIAKQKPVDYEIGPPKEPTQILVMFRDQMRLEESISVHIKSVAESKISKQILKKYLEIWLNHVQVWRHVLTNALEKDIKEMKASLNPDNKIHLVHYICAINRKTLVDLMLDEIEKNAFFLNYSATGSVLHKDLGLRVMKQYIFQIGLKDGSLKERSILYEDYLRDYYLNPHVAGSQNSREFIQRRANQTKNYAIYKDRISPVVEWPRQVIESIGKFLYGIILREVKFDPVAASNPQREIKSSRMIDAFYTAYCQMSNSYKIKEEFRTHREFEKLQRKCTAIRLRFDHSQLPCGSPPMPWVNQTIGGYLCSPTSIVRVHPMQEQNPLKYADTQKLYPSLDSLNALGLCPWIVNKDILDIVIKLFRSGGNMDLNIPLDEHKMRINAPTRPAKLSTLADKIIYRKEIRTYDKKRAEMYSLWADCLYRLSIANHFRDRVFWFPHNLDFRGRTYPVAPHFNHLGADLPRSLLLFAKGQMLGEKGFDWLKLHLINLGGQMKKASVQERLDYVNSILHTEVLDSADNPFDGRGWWQKHDNPWQVLACCNEIAKAIRSRNVKEYVSHLPIHQDGSCNGLQHYAALGRDSQGALAVNLIPSDRPHDVYSHIVDLVESQRQIEAQDGNEVAKMLDGLVQRKVIKQTVMTTVYGVTRYGAHNQIAKQLSAKNYPPDKIWSAAQYLTTKTFKSIGQMFTKSTLIQDWLNRCAKTVASRFNRPVDWETPLGLPVCQPYVKNPEKQNSDIPCLSSFELVDQGMFSNRARRATLLDKSKHKTAFPPNFIHSLDSSHMMLTSVYCQRAGLTFVSVHDCFWTHARSVDLMNRICREQFVALHSEPLLENLANHFMKRYGSVSEETQTQNVPDYEDQMSLACRLDTANKLATGEQRLIFADVPKPGDLDLNVVKDSVYFFS